MASTFFSNLAKYFTDSLTGDKHNGMLEAPSGVLGPPGHMKLHQEEIVQGGKGKKCNVKLIKPLDSVGAWHPLL